jgi:two-component system, OmpR family, KDP operon response regulator KdpE
MRKSRILVIDDEAQIQKLLHITLKSHDFEVVQAGTAKEGMELAASNLPDVILLDLGLPDINGHEVLTKLRAWFINPVIILSVQSREEDIVKALDNGANDYLIKPFRTGELIARIRSSLRKQIPESIKYSEGGNSLEIDFNSRTVKRGHEILKLTATEFDLLALLARNEGRVLTHQTLLRQVWGPGYLNQTQYLRVFIGQLRKKIEKEPNHPEFIITESGVGYRFITKE